MRSRGACARAREGSRELETRCAADPREPRPATRVVVRVGAFGLEQWGSKWSGAEGCAPRVQTRGLGTAAPSLAAGPGDRAQDPFPPSGFAAGAVEMCPANETASRGRRVVTVPEPSVCNPLAHLGELVLYQSRAGVSALSQGSPRGGTCCRREQQRRFGGAGEKVRAETRDVNWQRKAKTRR